MNQNDINRRVKELRKTLKMTQVSFSQVIALSSGYLAGIETEKRRVNDRLIKLICSSFKVNEQWLREGEGAIFTTSVDEQSIKLLGLWGELEPKFREYVLKEIALLLKMSNNKNQREETLG